MWGGEIDLPSIHGEISVEHLLAHLLPLNSPGKFQVRELISQQVGLHETLEDGQTAAVVSQADKKTGKVWGLNEIIIRRFGFFCWICSLDSANISYFDHFWFSNTCTCTSVLQIIHELTCGHTTKITHALSIYQSVGFYPSISLSSQLNILFILFNLTDVYSWNPEETRKVEQENTANCQWL